MSDTTPDPKPLISVIIPAHNRAGLLPRAIRSILSQTYDNYEAVIADDCSTDNTEEVVKSFKDERIVYVRHNRNRGANAARNTGIRLARGRFIAFLDSDDEYLPRKLERTVEILNDSLPDVGVVYSCVLRTRGEGRGMIKCLDRGISGNIYIQELLANYVCIDTALVRKECFSKELFDEDLPGYQDWDLFIRLARHYKFVYIDEPLAIWHHEDTRERISNNLRSVIVANKRFLEKYGEDLKAFPKQHSDFFYRIGHNCCKLGETKEGRSYLRRSLAHYPLNTKAMMALALSSLGSAVYKKMVTTRQSCQR
jgi:glycosyltransferase involved in cell wall biosynthesis